jgi:hypothetical protein
VTDVAGLSRRFNIERRKPQYSWYPFIVFTKKFIREIVFLFFLKATAYLGSQSIVIFSLRIVFLARMTR